MGVATYQPGHPPSAGATQTASLAGFDLWLSWGRYYLWGLMLENRPPEELLQIDPSFSPFPALPSGDSLFSRQPFHPGALLPSPHSATNYDLLLTAQTRAVNALQEPSIREPALRGSDTTERLQLIWQLRLKERPSPSVFEPGPGALAARLPALVSALGNQGRVRLPAGRLRQVQLQAPGARGFSIWKSYSGVMTPIVIAGRTPWSARLTEPLIAEKPPLR